MFLTLCTRFLNRQTERERKDTTRKKRDHHFDDIHPVGGPFKKALKI